MPRSASAIVGALVFALTIFGMTDASMTLAPATPQDSECFTNDLSGSSLRPIRHVPTGMPVSAHGMADVVRKCCVVLSATPGNSSSRERLTQRRRVRELARNSAGPR